MEKYPNKVVGNSDLKIRVSLENLGEGYNGDYDPNDPNDKPLLRFDVEQMDFATEEWQEDRWISLESRCTCIPVDAPVERLERFVSELADEVYDLLIDGRDSLSFLCDKFSYAS